MIFENLVVSRVIMHEIYKRDENRNLLPPTFSDELESLTVDALTAFRERMTEALSRDSKSLSMGIAKTGQESFVALADELHKASNDDFVQLSKNVASKMAESQTSINLPGGIVIVFSGTVGVNSFPYVGVIKAETQAGFRRAQNDEGAFIEFLRNIFLTPATRLYKVGIMVKLTQSENLDEAWSAKVFDSNITAGKREAAATYFYDTFLGCVLPQDGPYETQRFFDLTKDFVLKTGLDADSKSNLMDSLFVFVRDDKSQTFTTSEFRDNYLPEELRDPYKKFMEAKKFRADAVVRDTSAMGNRLKRRRLKFGTDITLSASPDALSERVKIDAVKAKNKDGDTVDQTIITIDAPLTGEE